MESSDAQLDLLRAQKEEQRHKPIQPERHHVVARPSMVSGRNRYATLPANAMLNYAYAVLETLVRIATVSYGLDPRIGYLHASRQGRVALVYDLMQPLRPRRDRLVLDFVLAPPFVQDDFVLGANGVDNDITILDLIHYLLRAYNARSVQNDG